MKVIVTRTIRIEETIELTPEQYCLVHAKPSIINPFVQSLPANAVVKELSVNFQSTADLRELEDFLDEHAQVN